MKNLFIYAILCLLMVGQVSAQGSTDSSVPDDNFTFGFKVTPTYNWYSIDRKGYDADGGFIGITYGVIMDFKFGSNYFFETGVEFSKRGGKYKSTLIMLDGVLLPQSAKITQRLEFIDIPLNIKLKTNEIGYSRYYVLFGVQPSFMIGANQDIDFDNGAFDNRKKRDNNSDFGFFNFGLNVGAGYEYRFSKNNSISAGVAYHNGFIDLWSDSNASIKSQFVTLNLALFF